MIKILIVDDEKIVIDGLLRYFKDIKDVEIQFARNGKDGLQLYHEFHPDLIITDIQMPGMTGMEMLDEIRNVDTDVMAIVLSAYNQFEYTKKSIQNSVFDYILKPIGKKAFLEVIEKALEEIKEKKNKKNDKGLDRESRELIATSFFRELLISSLKEIELDFYREGLDLEFESGIFIVFDKEELFRKSDLQQVRKYVKDYSAIVSLIKHQLVIYIEDLFGIDLLIDNLFELDYMKDAKVCYTDVIDFESDEFILFKAILTLKHQSDKKLKYGELDINDEVGLLDGICLGNIIRVSEEGYLDRDMFQAIIRNYRLSTNKLLADQSIKEWFYQLVFFAKFNKWSLESDYRYIIESLSGDELIDYVSDKFDTWAFENNYVSEDSFSEITKSSIEIIKGKYNGNLTLEAVADEVAVSVPYLSKIFKQDTKITFTEYLNQLRIEKSKLLLKDGMSITDTSYEVGYNDPNYFIRKFKKITGMTPKEFQKENA
jgi:two-component system response regulator YesN